jgi:nucleoside-diphosphate-sugar epimerase
LAEKGFEPGWRVFNLSSGKGTSIREVALMLQNIVNYDTELLETEPNEKTYDDKVVLSIQRLIDRTDWHPEWSLEEGLAQTLKEMEEAEK